MKEIRNDSYAIYRGREYRYTTNWIEKGFVRLISHDPADEELGFISYQGERDLFTKDVPSTEIEEGYVVDTHGIYRGIDVIVANSNIEGNVSVIPFNNNDAWIAEIPAVEPNHYEMDVPAEEVTEIHEIRRPRLMDGLPFKG